MICHFDKISETKKWLDQDKTIFEGSFLWDKCFCMVDILLHMKMVGN